MAVLEPGVVLPTIPLRDAAGAPVTVPPGESLLAVFKTTCPTCELAWPYLERIRQAAEGGSLRVLAVSQDDPEKTSAFNRRLGVRVETAYDPEPWPASDALAVAIVPTFLRVGPGGLLEETAVGFQRDRMESFARRASSLAGRPYTGLFRKGEQVPAVRPG